MPAWVNLAVLVAPHPNCAKMKGSENFATGPGKIVRSWAAIHARLNYARLRSHARKLGRPSEILTTLEETRVFSRLKPFKSAGEIFRGAVNKLRNISAFFRTMP